MAGYVRTVDHKCEPLLCDEGPGSLCKRCQEQDMLTADDQCAECNPGYALTEDQGPFRPFMKQTWPHP